MLGGATAIPNSEVGGKTHGVFKCTILIAPFACPHRVRTISSWGWFALLAKVAFHDLWCLHLGTILMHEQNAKVVAGDHGCGQPAYGRQDDKSRKPLACGGSLTS